MGADAALVCTEEVAKDLQSDFQRNREEAWGSCSVGSLVWVIASFLRLKKLFESGEGGCKCTIYTILDPSLD